MKPGENRDSSLIVQIKPMMHFHLSAIPMFFVLKLKSFFFIGKSSETAVPELRSVHPTHVCVTGVSNCKIKADLVGLVKTMEHFIQLLGRPLEETSDLVKQGEQRYYELMSQSSAVKKTAVEIGD